MSGPTPDVATKERRDVIYRKVTVRIVPFLIVAYLANYLDRINIGFAKPMLSIDLGFSDAVYGLGAGLFFIGYFFLEVPSNMAMHRIGARATLARIMILWGIISGSFALVGEAWHFYLLRFLLGAAEAGFYPGVLLLLTYWFPSERRAKVIALFVCAIPLSGTVGGPVSGVIPSGTDGWLDLAGWQ